jgi:hypothetical protein
MVAVVEVTTESNIATGSTNVWHWRIPEANVGTEVAAIVSALDTFYEALDNYLQAQTWTIPTRVVTVDKNPNQEIGASGTTAANVAAGGPILAGCAVASYRGVFVGRRYRGRKYLGPLASASVQSNGRLLVTGARDAILAALVALGTDDTAGIEFGVWSRKFTSFTPATVFTCDPVIGIQRRRMY